MALLEMTGEVLAIGFIRKNSFLRRYNWVLARRDIVRH